jgi:hypothetical protein
MTYTCPGLCGRVLPNRTTFACRYCTRDLPYELRMRLGATHRAQQWPEHCRALSDALLWMSANRRNRKEHKP